MLPAFGIVSRSLRLPFEISSSLTRDVQCDVLLKVFQDGREVEELQQAITLPAMGTVNESLLWKPQSTGNFELALTVPSQNGELVEENNRRIVPISIREEAIKVLLIESFPRWEYRYLRNALERDPGVDVTCLLFHPGLSKRGGGRGYIKAFPSTQEELAEFDVVFLGDVGVGENQLTLEQCRLLKGLVRSQASGLIFMPGMRGQHLALSATELDELYPVVLDQNQPKGWGSREPAQFELTETGRRSLLTKLEDEERANADLWENLPGFHWYAAAIRSKAGTEVLATHKTEMGPRGRIPLLGDQVLRHWQSALYGHRRSLALAKGRRRQIPLPFLGPSRALDVLPAQYCPRRTDAVVLFARSSARRFTRDVERQRDESVGGTASDKAMLPSRPLRPTARRKRCDCGPAMTSGDYLRGPSRPINEVSIRMVLGLPRK